MDIVIMKMLPVACENDTITVKGVTAPLLNEIQ